MTCPGCGRWAQMDDKTGYDVDELCHKCQKEEEEEMDNKHDDIWDEAVNAASEVIDTDTRSFGMTEEEAGEIYLEVADELRMRGNAMIGE